MAERQVWDTGRMRGPHHGPQPVRESLGWVLRAARLLSPDPRHATLASMAALVGSNATRLHRLELGALRDSGLATAYEHVLDLPRGVLSAPPAIVARSFRTEVPPDRHPPDGPADVRRVSALTEALVAGEPAPGADAGGTWLEWATALGRPGAVGLPESTATVLLDRLTGELNRAVGAAYPRRYEALSVMRRGPYGHLVVEVARARVADPAVQVVNDMMSAVAERHDRELLAWATAMLHDERDHVVEAGAVAIENLWLTGDDPGFWEVLGPRLVDLLNDLAAGTLRRQLGSHLLRLAPPHVGQVVVRRLTAPLEPSGPVEGGRGGLAESLAAECGRIAEGAARDVGLPGPQPTLASMVFDITLSPLEARGVSAYMLLSALPDLVAALTERVADLASSVEDDTVRRRMVRRLSGTRWGVFPSAAPQWWTSPHEDLRDRSLVLAGHGGVRPPDAVTRPLLATDGPAARAAVAAVGLSSPTDVAGLARDAGLPAGTRAAAAWWAREGGRVADGTGAQLP